jgi:hypothetical protein
MGIPFRNEALQANAVLNLEEVQSHDQQADCRHYVHRYGSLVMQRAHRLVGVARRLTDFAGRDAGGMTVVSLCGLFTCAMAAGVAVDMTNLHRHKERLTLAADAAAHAAIVAMAEEKTSADIKAAALAAVERSSAERGLMYIGPENVQLVRFDPATHTLVPGTPNAVQVVLHHKDGADTPLQTGFLRLAGYDAFELSVESVAFFGAPGDCRSSDGTDVMGAATLVSGKTIETKFCGENRTAVWMAE